MIPKLPKDTRILLVDDDADFREAVGFLFADKGFQVSLANDGNEAFALAQEKPFDVVIADICMPGCSGTELLKIMRDHGMEVPIVLFVTDFSAVMTEDVRKRGATALFSKPFDSRALAETIDAFLFSANASVSGEEPDSSWPWRVELRTARGSLPIARAAIDIDRSEMRVALRDGEYPNINEDIAFTLTTHSPDKCLNGNGIVRWIKMRKGQDAGANCGIEFTCFNEPELRSLIESSEARLTF